MQRGHAIDPVAPHRGEMGHTDILLTAFIDNRKPGNPLVISGIAETDSVEKSAVDLVDDLQMPGKAAAE